MNAKQVVEETHKQLREADKAIREHPYIKALQRGDFPVEAIKALPGHQHHIAISDIRSMATVVQRFGDTPHIGFYNDLLQGELAAPAGILALARKLGMSEADLDAYEPDPEGFAYAAYLAWLAVYGSAAELVCGFLVNFAAWGENCGQVSAALHANYGFAKEDTVFLDAFAGLPSFETTALEIIQDGLDQGVKPERIYRSSRLFQGYEMMFWNTMAKAAET